MPTIDCALLSEGSSDAALVPVIQWTVEQHAAQSLVAVEWADLRHSLKPARSLVMRIREAVALYPCDILFVHRDADRQPPESRRDEITSAIAEARGQGVLVPHVCVVPVRMQEAWLLLDQTAIRRAAGNPNGRIDLAMPDTARIERIPDPKDTLCGLLRTASELHGRRLRAFHPGRCARLVTSHMQNMAILRGLPAFRRFESDVRDVLARWNQENRHG